MGLMVVCLTCPHGVSVVFTYTVLCTHVPVVCLAASSPSLGRLPIRGPILNFVGAPAARSPGLCDEKQIFRILCWW